MVSRTFVLFGVQLAVALEHMAVVAELAGQHLDQINRAVLAAGAADGDGEVAALVGREMRQPARQESADLAQHHADLGLGRQVAGHRRVAAGQRAQLAVVVGVGQHAHVEHEIGVARHAVLEREALEHQGQLAAGVGAHQVGQPGAQLGRAQLAGVDDGGLGLQPAEQLALQLDRVQQQPVLVFGAAVQVSEAGLAVLAQRVGATGFGEAAHQRFIAGVQEDGAHRHAAGAQLLEQRQHQRQRAGAAHVHRDGDTAFAALLLQLEKVQQQFDRQVVDAEIARVLQRMHGDRLAAARHAGQQHDIALHFLFDAHDLAFFVGGAVREAASISSACARLVEDSRSPPSMRAISATRASPDTGATLLDVAPSCMLLATTR
mmetsp:Transcript_15320/g.36540  ORF Transcript_15320/g.36540 Transcript_15320/m.36540 type:complete len:376 (-) Transcript_15320:629-1756(-)